MLLRQLHRPLLRSVTAAWRPATTSLTPCYHRGDNRTSSSSSSNSTDSSNQHQEAGDQHEASSAAPSEPKLSLFNSLFPDEAKRLQAKQGEPPTGNTLKDAWASRLIDDEPPRLAVPEELQGEDGSEEDLSARFHSDLRAKAVLILSAASKNLLESDFLRLGTKGKHIEGWVGGILKVIQARDPDTLEPQGHYFILFDTHEAAMAYRDRIEQLWGLAKAYVPGAHHARWHMRQQQPLPRGLRHTEQGEDVADLIRSFTLVPPSQRHHVQLSRMSPARIAELYLEGGFVDRLAARAGSESLVLICPDGGRLTLDTLRRAIADDGVRRNLPWRITDLDNGILPFGKSILKAQDRVPVDTPPTKPSADKEGVPANPAGDSHNGTSGSDTGKGLADVIYGAAAVESSEMYRQFPRFIVPFMDKEEAHRFVQSWHRRELRLGMGGGGKDQLLWEESRVINATILW